MREGGREGEAYRGEDLGKANEEVSRDLDQDVDFVGD